MRVATLFGIVLLWRIQSHSCDEQEIETEKPKPESECYCLASLDTFDPNLHPIFINGTDQQVLYPNKPYLQYHLTTGQQIEFHCPQSWVIVKNASFKGSVTGTCVWGDLIDIDKKLVPFSNILCKHEIQSSIKVTGESCYPQGVWVKVGFDLDNGTFLTQYTICFDMINKAPVSTFHHLKSWASFSTFHILSEFRDSDFFDIGISTNKLYEFEFQRTMINKQVARVSNDTRYINSAMLLKRLTLVPRSNFIYKYEKATTRWSVNVVPQWSTIAQYNWHRIEKIGRKYSGVTKHDLEVYSGVLSTMKLFDEKTGEAETIYLYSKDDVQAFPVPFIIWKAFYDPINRKAVVLLSVNNPFYKNASSSLVCPEQSEWYGNVWPFDTRKEHYYPFGYVYACSLPDFRKVVKNIPDSPVDGLMDFFF